MTDAKREKSQPDDEVRYTGTGTYWYVLVRTGTYWYVLVRTGTYWYVLAADIQI